MIVNMEKKRDLRTVTPALVAVMAAYFVMGVVDIAGVGASYVKADFGLSDTVSSLVPTVVFLSFAVCSVPAGLLMGRIGSKGTVLLSLVTTSVAMALPLVSYDFVTVAAAFLLLGISNTLLQVSLSPLAAALAAPERLAGVLTSGQFVKAVSSLLGPVLAGVAASVFFSWKAVFVCYCAVSAAVSWFVWRSVRVEDRVGETGRVSLGSMLGLLADRGVIAAFAGILSVVALDVGLNIASPKLVMAAGDVPLSLAGLGGSLYFAARIAGTLAGVLLMSRVRHSVLFRCSVWAAAVSFVLLVVASGVVWTLVALAMLGFFCANVFPLILSRVLLRLPDRSAEVSALMMTGVAGGALAAPLTGLSADLFGQHAVAWPLGIAVGYLAVWAACGWRR